jgi:hypothetical protein
MGPDVLRARERRQLLASFRIRAHELAIGREQIGVAVPVVAARIDGKAVGRGTVKPAASRVPESLVVYPSPSENHMKRIVIVLLAGLLGSCAGSPGSPSEEQVAGAWAANSTLAAASGGECLGSTVAAAGGSRDIFTAGINQSGNSLDAMVTSQGNGTTCAYSGAVSGGTVTLTLTSCQTGRINGVRCSDGSRRDVQMIANRITASTASGSGAGTDSSTWNVFVPGSTVPAGVLSVRATFSWIALGLPASDYHTMTGTVQPGYQDGTITIGAPEPFCITCGWFTLGS